MSAYTASKYALHGFVQSLRSEVDGSGVHVCEVHPGIVKTNSMERTEFYGATSDADRKSFRQVLRTPMVAQLPAEVAEAIYGAVISRQSEAVVGLPFAMAAAAYQATGINVSAMPFM